MSTSVLHRDLPTGLLRAQKKFERWRDQHRPRARIPEELWREAAQLAGVHGIHRTAQALRLAYYSLKERTAALAGSGSRRAGTEFVELLPGAMPALRAECLIEFEDARGLKMRIHLPGGELPDMAALARVFRDGGGS